MAYALILMPVLLAALAFAIGSNRWRPILLPVAGFGHFALTMLVLARPELAGASPALALDAPGRLVQLLVSGLYMVCSPYAVGYLRYRSERPNRVFCACLLAFPGVLSLVCWSQHLGLMWVGVEAIALVTAPLIYFNNTPRSIEATWKYLLIGSVGIALALLGSFLLAYASLHAGLESSLTFESLLRHAPQLSKPWLHAAFALLIVGYGTKMGLAPMHTWKPDAYGEAPGMIGALMAGGVTSCAFLAVLRVYAICQAAGEGAYSSGILIFMGLFSMGVAGVFMVGQKDFKRMLAYSSVEHMGILVLGVGIGGAALFGALLHLIVNGLTKGVLFLTAGNIHRAFGSKSTEGVRGAIRRLPCSGALFLAGFLAVTGSPPFGPFISEFTILNAAFAAGRYTTGGLFLALLLFVFIGMGATVLAVVQGVPPAETPVGEGGQIYRENTLTCLPPLFLMALVLLLGLYIPGPLNDMILDACRFLEVAP